MPAYGSTRYLLLWGPGSNEYAPHVSGDWMMAPFHPRTTHSSSTMHARASSDVLQATNVPTYIDREQNVLGSPLTIAHEVGFVSAQSQELRPIRRLHPAARPQL